MIVRVGRDLEVQGVQDVEGHGDSSRSGRREVGRVGGNPAVKLGHVDWKDMREEQALRQKAK